MINFLQVYNLYMNPLTPVLPITSRDELWLFFHFWHHHLWPKLASSIHTVLNFCRRKRSLQWCPDQSVRPNGAWDMLKNAQKVKWKTQSKISCHYTRLLHGKNCPSRWCFLRSFLTASKPSRRSITAAKRKEKQKKERRKKFQKSTSLKTCRPLSRPKTISVKILISVHTRITMSQNAMLVARKACCRVAKLTHFRAD